MTQIEVLGEPPAKRPDDLTPWPRWPMKLRTSYALKEGGERDFAISTTQLSGSDGVVEQIHWAQNDGSPPFAPIPGTEESRPAELVLLAMGFLHPEQRLLEQLGVERDARGNAQRPGLCDVGRRRLRGRRCAPRPVADRLGDQRGAPVRRAGRPLARAGSMTRAVILSAVRTPIGRYGAGSRPSGRTTSRRSRSRRRSSGPGSTRREIEDVWLGCANQAGEDNRNVARFAALLAGLPDAVGGVTVNRLCASGLAAVVGACHAVDRRGRRPLRRRRRGVDDAGATRHRKARRAVRAGRATALRHDPRLALRNPRYEERYSSEAMGETGENVAERWGVSRERPGRVRAPLAGAMGGGCRCRAVRRRARPRRRAQRGDEHPRPETTAEKLGSLKPAFRATAPSPPATRAGSTTAPRRS